MTTEHSVVYGREADDRTQFLYVNEPGAKNTVYEYQHHMHAPHFVLEDLSEKHKEFTAKIDTHNSTEGDIRPFFLRDDYPIPRITCFYSPWCGHCQSFVPRYLGTAKEVLSSLPPYHIEFFAISCSEHHALCQKESIKAYPTIRAYPSYTNEPIPLKTFTVQSIDDALKLNIMQNSVQSYASIVSEGQEGEAGGADEGVEGTFLTSEAGSVSSTSSFNKKELDILGATTYGYKHSRTDTYRDAALSFTYALQHHVFEEDQTELTPAQSHALREWLDLLYWTLPPTWMVHTLINDLRLDFDILVRNKTTLMEHIHSFQPVVHDKKDMQWSPGCQNGDGIIDSFSCGLWALFHIVSVGVPERHASVLGHRHRIATKHVVQVFQDYILHFFGWCPTCRDDFLELLDNCEFNSCRRFHQRRKKRRNNPVPPPEHTWKEVPLWMWEVHNHVNEKLAQREFHKLHHRKATTEQEMETAARWPSIRDCIDCYIDGSGTVDKKQVFQHLKEQYWPTGKHNFRYVVLDKDAPQDGSASSWWWYTEIVDEIHGLYLDFVSGTVTVVHYAILGVGLVVLVVATLVGFLLACNKLRARRIRRTGRHKKYDVDPLFDP